MPGYGVAVAVYAGCAVLELLSEPVWVAAQILLVVKLKVVAEGLALAVRCVLTLVLLALWPALGLYSFCIAQLAYSCTVVAVYYADFARRLPRRQHPGCPLTSVRQLLPAAQTGRSVWLVSTPAELTGLAYGFFWQSMLKQLLTEGERYVMTFLGVLSFEQQGVYDVVNNLGSLVARFLFQPIEDNFYAFFAGALTRDGEEEEEENEKNEKKKKKKNNVSMKDR